MVSLGVPMKKCWVVAGLGNVSGDGGGWLLDVAVALFLICVSVINSSVSDIGTGVSTGLIGVNVLGGFMWCICWVMVGLFCLNISPLWFIVVSSLLLLDASPLCCSSVCI